MKCVALIVEFQARFISHSQWTVGIHNWLPLTRPPTGETLPKERTTESQCSRWDQESKGKPFVFLYVCALRLVVNFQTCWIINKVNSTASMIPCCCKWKSWFSLFAREYFSHKEVSHDDRLVLKNFRCLVFKVKQLQLEVGHCNQNTNILYNMCTSTWVKWT